MRWRPAVGERYTPTRPGDRVWANVAALTLLRDLERDRRAATAEDQAVLARWSGWGAVPAVFDYADNTYATARTQLQALVGEEWDAARRTVINAHYTDPSVVAAMWSALTRLGFDGGRVLEPGCGSGNFVGYAPDGARMVGVERDPTTAAIARALYPDAEIRTGPLERFDPREPFDAAVGNVPFAKVTPHDPRYNRGRHRTGVSGISELSEWPASSRSGHG